MFDPNYVIDIFSGLWSTLRFPLVGPDSLSNLLPRRRHEVKAFVFDICSVIIDRIRVVYCNAKDIELWIRCVIYMYVLS